MAQAGQGTSRKARARRNRRLGLNPQQNTRTITTTTTTRGQRSNLQPTTNIVVAQRKSRRNKNRGGRSLLMDPFVATLRNPEDISGVKWPAPTDVPTGTFQLMSDLVATTDANGNFAIVAAPMVAQAPGNPGLGTYMNPASITAGGAITWAGATSAPFQGSINAAGIYGAVRCVSGCLKLEYIGNTSNDAGLICAAWDSLQMTNTSASLVSSLSNASSGWTTTSGIMNKPYGECYPLRNGVCVKWRPIDFSDAEFISTVAAYTLANFYPFVGLAVTGAAANSPFKIRIVFNYEGLPVSGSSNFINSTPNFGNQESITKAAVWGQTLTDKITPMFGNVAPKDQMDATLGLQTLDNTLKTLNRVYDAGTKVYKGYQMADKGVKLYEMLNKLTM